MGKWDATEEPGLCKTRIKIKSQDDLNLQENIPENANTDCFEVIYCVFPHLGTQIKVIYIIGKTPILKKSESMSMSSVYVISLWFCIPSAFILLITLMFLLNMIALFWSQLCH